ncbi:MAG: hypothetical protein HC880_15620 [Bacteroidia bacterium]|nr:hypothetical protein [Bacteroidia bacterium]
MYFYIQVLLLVLLVSQQTLLAQTMTRKLKEAAESNLTNVREMEYVILEEIVLDGNQRTRKHIILRELDILRGDTIYLPKADSILLRNRNKIFNTNLFVTVELSLEKTRNPYSRLRIKLEERWYISLAPSLSCPTAILTNGSTPTMPILAGQTMVCVWW